MLLEVVDEPARRADQDVAALAQGVPLLVVVDAPVHREDREPGVGAQQTRVGLDLHHQLAGGRDDEHARRGDRRPRGGRMGEAAGERGDEERGGLPGAGLGLARDVLAAQGERQGRLLDGGRGDEARVLDAAPHRVRQLERGELERAHATGLPGPGAAAGFFRPKIRAEMIPSS